MSNGTSTSYDEIPYEGRPFPQTHPDRLATVARLFGLDAAPGGTLPRPRTRLHRWGQSSPHGGRTARDAFLGVDLSGREIAAGQKTIEALGLKNIELRHLNIADVGDEFGTFDYIVCHGVYSWVPAPIQDKILDILRGD